MTAASVRWCCLVDRARRGEVLLDETARCREHGVWRCGVCEAAERTAARAAIREASKRA